MIRKERKARWTYRCSLCGIKATYPDQFRAIERQQRHERGVSHMATAIGKAFEPVADAIRKIGLAWQVPGGFSDAVAYAITDPNVPHDPTLRGDRRKWGGR